MTWTIIGITFIAWLALVVLFTPRIRYHVSTPIRPDTPDFLHILQFTCQAAIHSGNRVTVLTNGTQFYPAMRDAIRAAESSVNLEAYIFRSGRAADMLVDALVERAQAGVEVRLVLDAIGSALPGRAMLRRLRDAGCQVSFYQPIRWYRLHRLNNRTHRELLVIDGHIAFTGGAGVSDWWLEPSRHAPTWRDTMARVEGPIVAGLQGVFAENWLECRGEILTSPRHWPMVDAVGGVEAMIVKSSPSDRATSSRVVFQMLIEGAASRIDISTPYFLPDRALRLALLHAVQRGVRVRILVPGSLSDQRLVRLVSRRMFYELISGGVRIAEYRPSMIHVKALIVDDAWVVLGTTNVDNRSFEHNDEVNVAFLDHALTARVREDFEADLAASDLVTPRSWRERPLIEKLVWPISWILERQL